MKRILAFFVLTGAAFAQGIPYHQLRITPTTTVSAVGEIDFASKTNAHTIGLAAPDTVSANILFRLPATDGSSGNCLMTDGSHNLSFSSCTNALTVNGASVPLSQSCLGSNGSGQFVGGTCGGTTPPVTWSYGGGTILTLTSTSTNAQIGTGVSATTGGLSAAVFGQTSNTCSAYPCSNAGVEGAATSSGVGVYAHGAGTGKSFYADGGPAEINTTLTVDNNLTVTSGSTSVQFFQATGLSVFGTTSGGEGLFQNFSTAAGSSALQATSGTASGYAVKAVGAILTTYSSSTTGGGVVYVDGPNSNAKAVAFTMSGSNRWDIGAGNETESGTSTGTNFWITRLDNSGGFLDRPLTIERATGIVTIADGLIIGSGANFYNRTFTGGAPSCSGVNDGWMGFNTSTGVLYICNGGTATAH